MSFSRPREFLKRAPYFGWQHRGWHRLEQGWSDSPGRHYKPNENKSLVSPTFTVAGDNPQVNFTSDFDLEHLYDKVSLDYSTDGKNWTPLRRFTGRGGGLATTPLPPMEGPMQLRWHLTTDGETQRDGFRFTDLEVTSDRGVLFRDDAGAALISSLVGRVDPEVLNRAARQDALSPGSGNDLLRGLEPARETEIQFREDQLIVGDFTLELS